MLMIKNVEIKNFKGIRECKIADIKQINLFIGRNDSGKSSILEAIYTTCKECTTRALGDCLTRRSDRALGARELWYSYDLSSPIEISMGLNIDVTLGMRIAKVEEDSVSSTLFSSKPKDWNKETNRYNFQFGSLAPIHGSIAPPGPHQRDIIEHSKSTFMIDDSMRTKVSAIERKYLHNLVLSNKDVELATRHSDIYGKEASLLPLLHPDFPSERSRFALSGYPSRVFLDDFGDGPKYGLVIYAIAMTLKNTALFIEEIENHQHPGSLKKLIKHLIEIAKKNKLQLFVTTHSLEAFRQFYYYYTKPEDRNKEFQCFHVLRDAKSGIVKAKSEYNIQTIMEDIFEIKR